MVPAPASTPVLDALCSDYVESSWASGGEVRWLRHAWNTLTVLEQVPSEIPLEGIEGVDARMRLAALAFFSASFNYAGDSDVALPPSVTESLYPVDPHDVFRWMSSVGVETRNEDGEVVDSDDLYEEGEEPEVDTDLLSFCIEIVSDDVVSPYAGVRPLGEIFAELWAQRYSEDPEEVIQEPEGDGDQPVEGEQVHSTYPLRESDQVLVLNDSAEHSHIAYEWLDQYLARLR